MKMLNSNKIQTMVPIPVLMPNFTDISNGATPAPINSLNTILSAHALGAYGAYPHFPMQQLMAYMLMMQ